MGVVTLEENAQYYLKAVNDILDRPEDSNNIALLKLKAELLKSNEELLAPSVNHLNSEVQEMKELHNLIEIEFDGSYQKLAEHVLAGIELADTHGKTVDRAYIKRQWALYRTAQSLAKDND